MDTGEPRYVNVTTIKAKVKNVGTILTSIKDDKQLERVQKWAGAAEYIRVTSPKRIPEDNGLRHVRPIRQEPELGDLLRDYVMTIPGRSTFMIVTPDVLVSQDLSMLFNHVDGLKYQTWAAGLYAYDGPDMIPSNAPKAFVMTTSLLEEIASKVPNGLTFTNDAWAVWLHQFLAKNMMAPRYFQPNHLPLIHYPEVPVLNAYNLGFESPKQELKAENGVVTLPAKVEELVPIKHKPGRPKKK